MFLSWAGCSSVGCSSGVSICALENETCKIQCGPNHYRHGEYCYYCDEITETTPCQKCDDNGKCLQCLAGYALVNAECVACEGNTFSSDGSTCDEGPENCLESDHTKAWCIKCNEYSTLNTATGTCTGCETGKWSDGIKACVAITDQVVLDIIAHRLSEANGAECTAPQVSSCSSGKYCYGSSSCGVFYIQQQNNMVKFMFVLLCRFAF